MSKKTEPKILPAGEYWIGDPCYVIGNDNDDWEAILDKVGYFGIYESENWDNGAFEHKGKACWGHSTACGEGAYDLVDDNDEDIELLIVDSGMLSVVPVSVIDNDNAAHAGVYVTFDDNFSCSYDNGKFTFGGLTVDTGDDDDDDYF